MLTQFRHYYPQGSLISELIDIDRGLYLVKVSVEVEGVILATGLAGENTIELAEDAARVRAISTLVLEKGKIGEKETEETRKTRGQGYTGDRETGRQGDTGDTGDTGVLILKDTASHKDISEGVSFRAPSDNTGTREINNVSPVVPTQPKIQSKPEIKPPAPIPNPITQPVVAAVASENSKSSVTNNIATEVITEPETPPLETQEYQRNIFDQPIVEDAPSPEPVSPSEIETESTPPVQIDFNEIRHKTDLEMKRLNWTKEQGRDYLLSTYGKRSRLHLLDNELLEFLHYLETLES